MMLVDSHCHLDYPDFASEGVSAVVARARTAGVSHFLTICTEIAKFPQVLSVAEAFPFMFCTVGTHPHHAADVGEVNVTSSQLVSLSAHEKVVALGETGLDYFYNHSPREEQIRIFSNHVEAAAESGLPLVVHTRDADEDTVRVLRDVGRGKVRGVMHCFSGGPALADQALALGFYISFSGIITFKKADELRDVVKHVPLDRMLVETDAPYLAPIPHRGKTNEPAFVVQTAQVAANLKNMGLEELATITSNNFFTLFNKAKR